MNTRRPLPFLHRGHPPLPRDHIRFPSSYALYSNISRLVQAESAAAPGKCQTEHSFLPTSHRCYTCLRNSVGDRFAGPIISAMQDLCSWGRKLRWPLTFCWLSFAPPFNGLRHIGDISVKHATRAIQVTSYQYTQHKRKWACLIFSFGVFAHGILRYCARKFTLVCGTKKSRHRQTHDTHRKTEIHACTHRLALTDTCTHRLHTHTLTHRRAPHTHTHTHTHPHTHTHAH